MAQRTRTAQAFSSSHPFPAPHDLRAGRPGTEDAGQLPVQAEEAGRQRPSVAPADDHGGATRISGAQRHRDQGQTPHTSDKGAGDRESVAS